MVIAEKKVILKNGQICILGQSKCNIIFVRVDATQCCV